LRVFENTALKKIFGPKKVKVTGGWRRLYNEEFHSVYSSPNIIRIIKIRRLKWAEIAARIREIRNTTFWLGSVKLRDHSEDLDDDSWLSP
jgi:hypothetical protein